MSRDSESADREPEMSFQMLASMIGRAFPEKIKWVSVYEREQAAAHQGIQRVPAFMQDSLHES